MKQTGDMNMRKSQLQKWGGAAALYEALAYIIGFIGFIAVVNVGGIADPLDKDHGDSSKTRGCSLP